jgi:hypothetical protein
MIVVWLIGGAYTVACLRAAHEVTRSGWKRQNRRGRRLGKLLKVNGVLK